MKCPSCGGEKWKKGTVRHAVEVAGRTFEADLAATTCTQCGDPVVSHDELGRLEVAVARELARAGAHSGEAIRFMRKAIGLSAAELARSSASGDGRSRGGRRASVTRRSPLSRRSARWCSITPAAPRRWTACARWRRSRGAPR